MAEILNVYSNAFSIAYFLKQVLVIVCLFVCGFIMTSSSLSKNRNIMHICVLAFPSALAVFLVEAYVLLVVGIPYKRIIILSIFLITVMVFLIRGIITGKIKDRFCNVKLQEWIAVCVVVIFTACIASSGIMPVSLSNDSMYRLHAYPKYIVYFGHLRDQFDTFLTDTGLGAASIETIPFLFGFDEGFGIREFMHISFLGYFIKLVYDRIIKIDSASKKCTVFVSVIIGMMLASSSPAWILGHWVISNMYFMEFFFISAAEAIYLHSEKPETEDMLILAILSVACSLIRAEAGIFILLLSLGFSLLDIDLKKLSLMILLPSMVLSGAYAIKIYTSYTLDNPFTFLTPGKSMLQAAAFAGVIVYALFIKDKIPEKIIRFAPEIFVLGLLAVEALLFVYNRELFVADLKAFILNMIRQSGWGMLPELATGSAVIIIVVYIFDRVKGLRIERNAVDVYFLFLTVGFFLVTFAVSFMRGDALNVQVGDSGNRVLLQVVPFIVYTLMLYFVRLYERDKKYDNR